MPMPTPAELIVPVEGVQTSQLVDTWGAARSEGRKHEGIDIMARMGTPVRAAADGTIAKFFTSKRGGTTGYEFDQTGRIIYYYAHLSAYAAGLKEGDQVRQGQLIAYVGQTGNATMPHLHFEIRPSDMSGAVLRLLGRPPGWGGQDEFLDTLHDLYRVASASVRDAAFADLDEAPEAASDDEAASAPGGPASPNGHLAR